LYNVGASTACVQGPQSVRIEGSKDAAVASKAEETAKVGRHTLAVGALGLGAQELLVVAAVLLRLLPLNEAINAGIDGFLGRRSAVLVVAEMGVEP
jgi:hypothetical protein